MWKLAAMAGLALLCVWEVYPPGQKLKPGIDLAGGTSLLYQIDTTGLTDFEKREIAQQMIRILRQRIDPDDKMNLVWRPHGNDRIEVQMPLALAQTRELHQAYTDALGELRAANVDLRLVRQALVQAEGMNAEDYQSARQKKFEELAGGSADRVALLKALGAAHDARQAAEAQLEAPLEAQVAALQTLKAMNLAEASVLWLYRQWDQLDEPNRVLRVNDLVGGDEAKAEAVRSYIAARQEAEKLSQAVWREQTGLYALEKKAGQDLEAANFDVDLFERVVQAPATKRAEGLATLKGRFGQLADQIDAAAQKYDAYAKQSKRLDSPEDLKRLLRGSGVLEFRIAPRRGEGELAEAEIQRYLDGLKQYGPVKGGDDKYVWRPMRSPKEFPENVIHDESAGRPYVLLSNRLGEALLHEAGETAWRLQNARPDTDSKGRWAVAFQMNAIGTGRFFDLTKSNRGRPLCILLDNEAISAPTIQEAIYGRGEITGDFSFQDVRDLSDKLNAGSLPARLGDQPISENTVGPTLGKDNLQAGLRAGVYGFIVVTAFMVIYYWFLGALADLALVLNLLLIFAFMAFTRSTFTMPGIAGLILTIGMAVDANVLINERIREEQQRGCSLRMAIRNGYGRAFWTIFDSNLTTVLTALVLYLFASEEVKGFALTLIVGLACSMFTALVVTRTILDLGAEKRWLKDRLGMLRLIKVPRINWMGLLPIFLVFSGVLTIGGWAVFLGRDEAKNSKYAIEFTGGTSIHVLINEAGAATLLNEQEKAQGVALREKVEAAVQAEGRRLGNPLIAAARVQRIGREDQLPHEFEIVTTETNRLGATLQVQEGAAVTAEQMQAAVRQAGDALGDRRLRQATVRAGQKPGELILETSQTNRNVVRDDLTRALMSLAPLDIAAVSKTAAGTEAVLQTRSSAAVTMEQVQAVLAQAASDLRAGRLAQAKVEAGAAPGQFVLRSPETDVTLVRGVLRAALASLAPVQVGAIETNDLVSEAVRTALAGCLEELENLEPRDVQAEPITDELISRRPYLASYRGGLFLRAHFGPDRRETLPRLQDRLDRSQFRSGFELYGDATRTLFAPDSATTDPAAELTGVELTAVSEQVVYGASTPEEWNAFAGKESQRCTEMLNWQTSLPRVTQIDPSVGSKAKNDALVSIVFSVLAMLAYIWFRFGSVQFGLGVLVATVHDVSVVLGLVAASPWLAQTALGRALGIQDFKIDLPLIAAFLTLIGYSVNDTIVVFDRIRENRGKLALLSPGLINNSINQTLSRTILTGFTTLMVLFIMYIWGGPGLRGFNYVMGVGVLIGTYSSIAIAAPILLLFQRRVGEPAPARARPPAAALAKQP